MYVPQTYRSLGSVQENILGWGETRRLMRKCICKAMSLEPAGKGWDAELK